MSKKVLSLALAVLMLVTFVFNGTLAVFAADSALKITEQPTDAIVPIGQAAVATVVVEGKGLTYQWYVKSATASKFSASSIRMNTYSYIMTEAKADRQVYCVVTDKFGNTVTSDTVTFSLPSAVTITKQPVGAVARAGNSVFATVVANGKGLTYQWYIKDADDAAFKASSIRINTYSYTMTEEKDGRQAYCVIKDQYGNSVTSDTVAFSIPDAVAILAQPTGTVTAVGNSAVASVVATGEGLTYKWYIKDADDADFKASSVGTATYSFTMTADKGGRQAYCVVTDKYGYTVTSDTVSFIIPDAVTIVEQPTGTVTAVGNSAVASVVATGEGLTYKWYIKDADDADFKASSIRTATYSFTMTADKGGRQAYCVVADKHGNTVVSDTVTFIIPNAVAIVKQPVSDYALIGYNVDTTVVAEGDGLTYQWFLKGTDDAEFKASSIRTATYSYEMTADKANRLVYCVVTDLYGNSVTSDTVELSTPKAVTIVEQPISKYVPIGKEAITTIVAKGDGLTYQWYVKNDGDADFKASSVQIPAYTYIMDVAKSGRQVYCVVTDIYGNSVTSDVATFLISDLAITEQPVDAAGLIGDTLTATIAADGEELTFQWYVNGEAVADATATTFAVELTEGAVDSEVYCIVTDVYGNYKKSNTVVFGVGGVVITEQPVNVLDYAGNTATFTVNAEGKELAYQWYINGEIAAEATDSAFAVEVSKVLNGAEIYCVVTDKYGYSATSDVAVLTVYMYTITVDMGEGNIVVIDNILADGVYAIEDPAAREDFEFLGWLDEEGNPFPSTGTVDRDVTVTADWLALNVDADDLDLKNSKYLLTTEKDINVAFLGGSITAGYGSTAGNSWREKTMAWLGENFADATINEIEAACGGTGTYYAKHRLQKDLLANDPDLLFIEFVVNDKLDGLTAAQSQANMEAIVRMCYEHNPEMDIVFVYTTCVSIGTAKENTWINAFNNVAEHYGLDVIYAGAAMADYDGEMTDLFLEDQVHPNDAGYAIMADEVIARLGALLGEAGEPTEVAAHAFPDALTADLNLNAKIHTAVRLKKQNPALALGKQTFVGYTKDSIIMNPGDAFTFTFIGDSVGVYWRSEEAGGTTITVTLDGTQTVAKKAPKNSNGAAYVLFEGLAKESHTITFTNTGADVVYIPMIFTTDSTPTQQEINGVSVPAEGYWPEDRIEIGAVALEGSELSIEVKNISTAWQTDDDSYLEYTCYDAEGAILTVGKIDFGYIKANASKTCTVTLPENTASVVLTDFYAEFWSGLI